MLRLFYKLFFLFSIILLSTTASIAQYTATLITNNIYLTTQPLNYIRTTPRISDNLVVSGSVRDSNYPAVPNAILWSPSTGITNLHSSFPGLTYSWISAINNDLDIAGGFFSPQVNLPLLVMSPTLGNLTYNFTDPEEYNFGQIYDFASGGGSILLGVGASGISGGYRAMATFNGQAFDLNDYILSPLGYSRKLYTAEAINQTFKACGNSYNNNSGPGVNPLAQGYVFNLSTLTVTDLPGQAIVPNPNLAFSGSQAWDLNDNIVVGDSLFGYGLYSATTSAAYWDINTAALNLLPNPGPSGLTSGSSALAVNSANIIGGRTPDGAVIWSINPTVGTILNSTNVSGINPSHVLHSVIGISNPTATSPGCFLVFAANSQLAWLPTALYLVC